MTMSLLLRRLTPPSLTTPFPSSIHRLLFSSTATQQSPPPNSQFATEFLTQSCGLPPDKAIWASKYILHLKSPDKPDTVLRFLRQTGISESDIRNAVSRDPRILCSHVEKNWRPNVAKLLEVGFSTDDISCIISRSPGSFRFNFVPKIDFWMRALGSVENLSVALKMSRFLLKSNLEKVVMPNLSFLQEQCGLSVPQIVRLIKSAPRAVVSSPEALKIKAQRAEELGVRYSSPMFVYALIVICSLKQSNIDARLNNLKSLGLSQEEITTLVSNFPLVLLLPVNVMSRKIEFLTKEVGCDKLQVAQNPVVLKLSLEKRLIPRNLVRKLLESKGFPISNRSFIYLAKQTEKQFVEKMVLTYEHAIPGLHRAYTDACAMKTSANEWFNNISR